MNIKSNMKRIWAVVAFISLSLLAYSWFAGDSPKLLTTILVLDVLMFVLALPCSLFASAVTFFAWYVLEMNPLSVEGANLNTIVLSLLGAMQWFWIVRFWYPTESPFQKLDLLGNQT